MQRILMEKVCETTLIPLPQSIQLSMADVDGRDAEAHHLSAQDLCKCDLERLGCFQEPGKQFDCSSQYSMNAKRSPILHQISY